MACEDRSKYIPRGGRGDIRGGRGGGRHDSSERDRSPLRDDRFRDPYMDPFRGGGGPRPQFPPGRDFGPRDRFMPDNPKREPWAGEDSFRRDQFEDAYREPMRQRPPPPAVIECEIFVHNAQFRAYGDAVERRVKDNSIITAVSILPEGRTPQQMVEELSAQGCLFAIFINPQNEMHRSLTLNILHGTPQEHRNMPLDDAIALVGRSFLKYVDSLREKAQAAATPLPSSHTFLPASSEVNYLLNLLADNRALTILEIDLVIKYLQERRQKMAEADNHPILSEADSFGNVPPGDGFVKALQADSFGNVPQGNNFGNVPQGNNFSNVPLGNNFGNVPQGNNFVNVPQLNSFGKAPYKPLLEPNVDRLQSPSQQAATNSSKDPTILHQDLTNKILSLFSGGQGNVQGVPPANGTQQLPNKPAGTPQAPAVTNPALINFDNPNVQKALDNLIQSSPNLLKTINIKAPLTTPQVAGGLSNSTGGLGSTVNQIGAMGNMGVMDNMSNNLSALSNMPNPMASMGSSIYGQAGQQVLSSQGQAILTGALGIAHGQLMQSLGQGSHSFQGMYNMSVQGGHGTQDSQSQGYGQPSQSRY